VTKDSNRLPSEEKELQKKSETRSHELGTLLEISRTLASTLELQPGLILDQLHELVEYTHAGLFRLDKSVLVALAMRGSPQLEGTPPFHLSHQTGSSLAVLFNENQPIRIGNLWDDNKQARFLRSFLSEEAAPLLEGMQSLMWVPMAVKSRLIGGVAVMHGQLDYFTSHQAELVLSVANQAAITMINAELYRDAQALAVLEERQRLARNLHDAVNQSLFSAGLIAEVLPRLWERDQMEARRSLEDLRKLTRAAMAEMRALLAELRPSTLIDDDLGDLLRQLANTLTGRTNVAVNTIVIGKGVMPAMVQVATYRVCQEALNNIVKHAAATAVEIYLKYDETSLELTIIDNGQGFNPERSITGHYGLSMMHERAEAVGGLLSITSQPANGTRLSLSWSKDPAKGVT
jgi:two-component system nitrate/nitrite sensor histidine kinase NarX